MEYIYAALLLHSAKKEITEEAVSEVMKAAGIDVDAVRVKALVAALEDVDIDEAISKGVSLAPAAPTVVSEKEEVEEKEEKEEPEEKKEKEKEEEEESGIEGLGALFG
jgi:large subunit ribosomal protein L12